MLRVRDQRLGWGAVGGVSCLGGGLRSPSAFLVYDCVVHFIFILLALYTVILFSNAPVLHLYVAHFFKVHIGAAGYIENLSSLQYQHAVDVLQMTA